MDNTSPQQKSLFSILPEMESRSFQRVELKQSDEEKNQDTKDVSKSNMYVAEPLVIQKNNPHIARVRGSDAAEKTTTTSSSSSLPPMLRHYIEVKNENKDRIVFYQVGDFFEVFFDDAVRVSDCLSIRLTSRDKDQDNPIPMCGVPIHAFKGYAQKLLASGLSCVLVEQVEDAAQAKGLVKREVTKILTPGVIFETDSEDQNYTNYILTLVTSDHAGFSCTIMEASTGALYVYQSRAIEDIVSIVIRYQIREIVLSAQSGSLKEDLQSLLQGALAYQLCFSESENYKDSRNLLQSKIVCQEETREALSHLYDSASEELRQSIIMMVEYVLFVSRADNVLVSSIMQLHDGRTMILDGATIKNLELLTAVDGSREYSLIGVIDKTRTALGSRQLKEWILSPSIDPHTICQRLDTVEALVSNQELLSFIRQELYGVRDLERICTKLISGRISPYDIGLLHHSLCALPGIAASIRTHGTELLAKYASYFEGIPELTSLFENALQEVLPVRIGEGPIFKDTYNEELARLRTLEANSKNIISQIEVQEKQNTGISSLKIKYNSVLGYFIEVGAAHVTKVPDTYMRKQTLSNVERFFTPELKTLEKDLFSASAKIEHIERELFAELKAVCASYVTRIQAIAEHVGALDCLCSYAHIAVENNYVKPIIDSSTKSFIEKGRHPVVEKLLGRAQFTPNTVLLSHDAHYFSVLTGPNMGGKSTYLKQTGIIHILAQAGAFVPASHAHIGIVDQIFTRIGAGDNVSRGESTFMVEMKEASHIIASATEKSLVLVDELGRGTATADGYALALSIAEWLILNTKARTIFATHFHELNQLEDTFSQVNCLSVGIIETTQRIEFTHLIEHRAAEKSYGIHVAKLAGMPDAVLRRAREIADLGQQQVLSSQPRQIFVQKAQDREEHEKREEKRGEEKNKRLYDFLEVLAEKDPDSLTPKNALEVVYDMVAQARRLMSQ